MNKNKKTLIFISATLFSFATIGMYAVPRMTKEIKTFASQPYSCDLPNGYVEISEIIHDSLGHTESYSANTKKFRGTITKRNGDYAYVQRVNQTDSKLYGIRITGLNDYANDLQVGNVVDFNGGLIANDGGTPTFRFSGENQYVIVTETNPTSYDEKEFLNMDKINEHRATYESVEYSYSSFMKVSQLKVVGIYENRELFTDGIKRNFLQLSSIDGSNKFFAIVNAGDFSIIKTKATQAINENKYISVSGFFYGYAESSLLDVLSENDVAVEDSMIDTSVVSSRETMRLYFSNTNPDSSCNLYKLVGKEVIPYVMFDDFHANMVAATMNHPDYTVNNKFNYDISEGIYIYYNDDYSVKILVDTENDTIGFVKDTTAGALSHHGATSTGLLYLASGYETGYSMVNEDLSVGYTTKELPTFDLGSYGLDIVEDKYHNVYVPLHAMDYIFNATSDTVEFVYNGKDMYYVGGIKKAELDTEGTMSYKYKHDTPWATGDGTTSAIYGAYAYGATCFAIDYCYGLREHRSLFKDAGSADALFSTLKYNDDYNYKVLMNGTSTNNYELAILSFAGRYFFDGHSGYSYPGHYFMNQYSMDDVNTTYYNYLKDNYRYKLLTDQSELTEARTAAGKGVGYRKIGDDTAVITFDSFVKNSNSHSIDVDGYTYAELHKAGSELLFKKAFKAITADESIKNVVIDTTCNGGGMLDVLPWLEAYMTLDPTMTFNNLTYGMCNEIHYKVDLNYDGVFDSKDTYAGKYNFFLMTSNFSFSCGNYFPTVIKEKGMATIIGETSGGGACSVGYLVTPYGGVLRNSSNNQLGIWDSTLNKFVDNDEGIAPDYAFDRANFYDDEAIYTFIHNILNA